MKALSLTQPWATLIAIGAKRIETRSWSTSYRGPIAIHAAKGFPRWAKEQMRHEPFVSALANMGITADHETHANLPRGAIVAVATVTDMLLTGDSLNYAHTERTTRLPGGRTRTITPTEIAFGNYAPGRFMWLLDHIYRLPEPMTCRGALGLWTVPPDVYERLPLVGVGR